MNKGTLYCAVVKYRVNASDEEKIRDLRDGLGFVAMELVDLGCSIDSVEGWLEEAAMSAQDEADSIAAHDGRASS
jgi:hypothetical protein